MKLSEIKEILNDLESVQFELANGSAVPEHFHVTEVGLVNKRFIDCGGTMRNESKINFQLWTSDDYDHRLSAQKLKSIIELSEDKLDLPNVDIEVEYQGTTIGKYNLDYIEGKLVLTNQFTDCLAKENCGIPNEKPRIRLSTRPTDTVSQSCDPASGCC